MSTRDKYFSSTNLKIDASNVFAVIGTENYVRSLRDPEDAEHYLITDQIITARHLCKPIILLIDKFMDQDDKDYLRDYFKGFKMVKELPLDHTDDDAIKETVIRLVKVMEEKVKC